MKKVKLIPVMIILILILQMLVPIIPKSYSATFEDYEYEIKEDGTVEITKYVGRAAEVEIPSTIEGKTVTSIGDEAFYLCALTKKITIPNSVTSIGDCAFYECSGLSSITIPNSVTSIGNRAFYRCYSLTNVTIPDSVTSIEYSTFQDCTGLTNITIPNSVTSIGNRAFASCSKLTNITIPNGVTSIEEYTFTDCSSLTEVVIPDGVTIIGAGSFDGCRELRSVIIPNSVTSIGYGAFNECGLTSITIPNSVTSIGGQAFRYTGLRSITIPDSVTSIESATFYGCGHLASVTIPDSVTTIGNNAFSMCGNLTNITIPDSITKIESEAFRDCTNLASITIPDSVTSIGSNVFSRCDNLTITCKENSLAHKYAVSNNVKYSLIDETAPTIEIKYNKEDDKSTTVVITANEQIQPIEGWQLSEDKCTLSKNYTKGKIEEIIVKDLAGNQTTAKIEVIKIRANFTQTENSIKTTIDIGEIDKELLTYKIYIRKEVEEESKYVLKYEGKETEKTIGDLEPNTAYKIKLVAIYKDMEMKTEQTVTTSAKPSNPDSIKSPYEFDEENKELIGIKPNTKVEEVKNNITSTIDYEIVKPDGTKMESSEIVGTGCEIQFATGESYTIIVIGDTNGDGKVTIVDLARIKKHIVEIAQLEGEYKKAADINRDGKINTIDVSQVKKVLVGLMKL